MLFGFASTIPPSPPGFSPPPHHPPPPSPPPPPPPPSPLKLRVRRDALRLRQPHPPLHLVLLPPPQQQPHVIPRLPLVQQLAEHLHPRHHRLLVRPKPHHLHFLP